MYAGDRHIRYSCQSHTINSSARAQPYNYRFIIVIVALSHHFMKACDGAEGRENGNSASGCPRQKPGSLNRVKHASGGRFKGRQQVLLLIDSKSESQLTSNVSENVLLRTIACVCQCAAMTWSCETCACYSAHRSVGSTRVRRAHCCAWKYK